MSDAPDWYPDPFDRHEKRYYDGDTWTDRVSSHGRESVDPATGEARVPTVSRSTEKIRSDVAKAGGGAGGGGSGGAGGGTIFSAPALVVSQKVRSSS